MVIFNRKIELPRPSAALPGRAQPIPTAREHYLSGRPLRGPYPEGLAKAMFAMGCFWGAERLFWQLSPHIWITAAGYAGGVTPNPTYEEVCSGRTGHAEAVLVLFDATKLDYGALLAAFWENHDPTQGMRQGNDVGTQYRSVIFTFSEAQAAAAAASQQAYQRVLTLNGFGRITTSIQAAGEFYFAEEYHQQYLAKVPHGYCGLGGTGVSCPKPVKP